MISSDFKCLIADCHKTLNSCLVESLLQYDRLARQDISYPLAKACDLVDLRVLVKVLLLESEQLGCAEVLCYPLSGDLIYLLLVRNRTD